MQLWLLINSTCEPDAHDTESTVISTAIVYAENEIEARENVSRFPGAEGAGTWLNPDLSSCEKFEPYPGVLYTNVGVGPFVRPNHPDDITVCI